MTTLQQAFGGRGILCFPKPRPYQFILLWMCILCGNMALAQSYNTDSTSQTVYYDTVVKISTDTIPDTVYIANCDLDVRFQSDMSHGVLYKDSTGTRRNSFISFCPPNNETQLLFIFDRFDLEEGDTLYAYEGVVTGSGSAVSAESFITKGSGSGSSTFNGGWMSSSCDYTINPSGCVTFNFLTDGDFNKATGWDASISCMNRTVSLVPPDHNFVDLECLETKKQVTIGAGKILTGIDTTGLGLHFQPEDCKVSNDTILVELFNAQGILCRDTCLRADSTFTIDTLAIGTYTIKRSMKADTTIQANSHLAISPPPMICNDDINVSLDAGCGFGLSPDDILENPCMLTTTNMRYEMTITLGSGYQEIKITGDTPITGSGSSTSPSTPILWVPRDSLEKAGLTECGGEALVEVRRIYDYGDDCCSAGVIEDICWGYVSFRDESPPIAYKLSKDTVIACNTDLDYLAKLLGKPTVIDNCNNTTTDLVEVDIVTGAKCDSISRYATVWKIEDYCGNQTILRDTIYVERPTVANIVKLPDVEFSCGVDFEQAIEDLSITGIPKFALTTDTFDLSLDHYFCDFILVKKDDYVPHPGGIKLFRFWSLSDQCAERPIPMPIDTQVIEFIDTLLPTLICPANGKLETADYFSLDAFECAQTISLTPPAATDACDPNPRVEMIFVEKFENGTWDSIAPTLNEAGYLTADTFRVGWVAFDEVPLQAKDTCHSYFILYDVTPPSAICKDELHVSLATGGLPIIRPEDIDDLSWDACGIIHRDIRRTGEEFWSPEIYLECQDVYEPVRVELRVTDISGNQNSCWLFVDIIDNIPPVCHTLDDVVAYCDDFYSGDLGPTTDYDGDGEMSELEWVALPDSLLDLYSQHFGNPNCEDNLVCRSLYIDQQYQLIYRQCGEADIIRRYRVVDVHQPEEASPWQIQNVTVAYRPNWTITFPADWTGECGDDLPEAGITIDRGSCDILAWEHEEQVFDLVQDACYQVNRTFYVINWCTYIPGKEPIEVYRDENSFSEVGKETIIDFASYDNYGYYKYTQIIKINDYTAPTVTINPVETCIYGAGDVAPFGEADITPGITPFECDTIRVFSAEASDCEETFFKNFSFEYWIYENGVEVGYGESAKFFWTVQPKIDYTVRFRVHDNCGNVGEKEEHYEFMDCTTPTIVCQDTLVTSISVTGTALASPAVIAADSYDNCTLQSDLEFKIWHPKESAESPKTLEGILALPNAMALGCNHLGVQTVQVYILDGDHNYSSCVTQLYIDAGDYDCTQGEISNRVTLGGSILTENGEEVEQVAVLITGTQETTDPYKTKLDGTYHFELEKGEQYRIHPEKNINPLNGVSTFDLVLISKHILGIEKIASPYYQIAADINRNGQITAFDIVQLRQLILNIVPDFPDNESWRFVDASYVFETDDPIKESFKETIEVQLEEEDQMTNNFVAVKIGDINGNAAPNNLAITSSRNRNRLFKILAEDQYLEKGQTVQVSLQIEQQDLLEGWQFALAFPDLELVDMEEGVLQKQHIGWQLRGQHILPISWNLTGQSQSNLPLMTLTFEANKSGQLSELLSIEEQSLVAEAYTKQQEQVGLALAFADTKEQFEVLQNRPNPFKESTTISFYLPTDDLVTLTLLSMDGKQVKEWTQPFQKGTNEWTIHRRDFNLTGVLHYQLANSQQVATKKMIVLE